MIVLNQSIKIMQNCADTDSFIIFIKTEDVYEGIADDSEKRFDASRYKVDRPLPTGKNQKVIGSMKDELGGTIMTEFAALRRKSYLYLMDDSSNDKKAKRTKRCVIKRILKFNDYKNCLFKNETILKSQQRFKSEAHNLYTEEINKIALNSNDDKRLQTFDRITSYPYGISVGKKCKTELLEYLNKMIKFDDYTNEDKTEHNLKWPYIPDHPYRILIIRGSASGKINALLNLINNQPDIDKIYLYAKYPYEAKYQYLINKHKKVGLNHYDDPKAFIEYSNDVQDVYRNIEKYNLGKKRKVLIVFDDVINNKKLNPVVTELFIRGRKFNISIDFIKQSHLKVPKEVRRNTTHFFIMKISNKR